VWDLKNTSAQKVAGDDMQKGLNTYKKVSGWMVWSFVIALILSAAEFVVGFFAIFSRWGSLVTTVVSTVSPYLPYAPTHTHTHVIIDTNFTTGSNHLHPRRRRNRHISLHRPRRGLRIRAQTLQHQSHHGQANAERSLARRRFRSRIWLLLAR
jgi:hypothetical protein